MMNQRNQLLDRIEGLLEETGVFTPDEVEKVVDYISGNGDRAAIDAMPLRDMSSIRDDVASKMKDLMYEMIRRERDEVADRLSDVLFAAGRTSSYKLFPWSVRTENFGALASAPVKKAAIYAAHIGYSQWMVSQHTFKVLARFVGKNADALREVIDYQYKTPMGKLAALTVYFWVKYPDVKLSVLDADGERKDVEAGSPGTVKNGGDAGKTAWLDAEDVPLMQSYEDILISNLPALFDGVLRKSQLDKLMDAVRNDSVDGSILAMARGIPLCGPLRMVVGTTFVNFTLSPCLKNVLRICTASSSETILNGMKEMDLRGYLMAGGERLDGILGIDSKEYIKWAVGSKSLQLLREQFRNRRDIFLEYMEEADFDALNTMASIVEELDPELHKRQKDKECRRQQTKVTAALTRMVESAMHNDLESFLRGEAGVEVLCAWRGRIVYQGSRWGGKHWYMLVSYREIYGHDAFCARCEAMLMVCRGFNYSNYLMDGSDMKEERVKEVFGAVDSIGLPLLDQMNAYGDICDSFYADRWKKTFSSIAQQVFRGYLGDRREEMVAAVQNTGSTSRVFGLGLLTEKPEEYRQVILGFSQDSSKAVREALLDILYGKRGWEEDVLGMLSSKKAAEREIAVRVLVKWDEEAYAPVLAKVLEKEKNGKVRTLLETALHVEGGADSGRQAGVP